mmetsp:Transcript_27374/g.85461  ORF Transcript_27374/g.85461 Transcript_27374/m.85461 type:complete len:269 (-) Transcript_27374:1342-2148(-)
MGAVRLEGSPPGQELEEQHAQHPPVHGPAVSGAQDHLWSHVVRRADERVGLSVRDLGQTHVRELAIAASVEQEVLRLQVAVYDQALVEMRQGLRHAAHVEARVPLAPVEPQALVGREKLASQRGLQEEIDVLASIVGCEQPDHEGRFHHLQDPLLIKHRVLHAQLRQVPLGHGLQGIRPPGAAVSLERHDAEGAHAQAADALEVRAPDALLAGLGGARASSRERIPRGGRTSSGYCHACGQGRDCCRAGAHWRRACCRGCGWTRGGWW